MANRLSADSSTSVLVLEAGRSDYRGDDGPLALERGPATNQLFEAFLATTVEAGHPRTSDVNGRRQEGFNAFDRNIHRGRRLSAARAYLHPVKSFSAAGPAALLEGLGIDVVADIAAVGENLQGQPWRPTRRSWRGVDGLRVVAASSMLAEKSADLILGNTPLSPVSSPSPS